MSGVVEGVVHSRSAMSDHITDMMQVLEDDAREKTKTRSPSLVWMELGHDLMDGLAIGIQDGAEQAAQAAAEAAERVTTSFTVPVTTEFNTLGGEISDTLKEDRKSVV